MESSIRKYLGWIYQNGEIAEPGGLAEGECLIEIRDDGPYSEYPIDWVKGNGILVSRCVFLMGITWEELRRQGFIYGKVVTLQGKSYLCRSLRLSNHGEWEQFVKATKEAVDWSSGHSGFYGQEFISGDGIFMPDRCSTAGHYAPEIVKAQKTNQSDDFTGFRMVLEPITQKRELTRGDIAQPVTAYCGSIRVDGSLVEFSDYDVVIRHRKNNQMPKDFGPGIYRDDNLTVIDRQVIQHLRVGAV